MNEIMDNKSRSQKAVEGTCRVISDKIDEIQTAYKAVPDLNRALEDAKWQRDAIYEIPDEEIDNEISTMLESQRNHWVTILGDQALSNLYPATTSAVGINVSGSSKIYSTLENYAKRNPQKDRPKILLLGYQEIQKSQEVVKDVYRKLKAIKQIKPSIGKQVPIGILFEDAMTAIKHAKSGTGSLSTAGNEMRNVLDQFKGTIYYRSLASKGKGSDEDRWKRMANYLAKNGAGSSEHAALVKEFKNYEKLQSDLSELTKRLSETDFDSSDFDSLVTRFLNHFDALLRLIYLDKLS